MTALQALLGFTAWTLALIGLVFGYRGLAYLKGTPITHWPRGVRHADDPEPLIAEGRWHGEIVDTPRGEGGFGYDPYFFLPEQGCTAAELDPSLKNTLSHRGQALRQLLKQLAARQLVTASLP